MKKVFLCLVILFLSLPVIGETLNAGISYTVEIARIEAFDNVPLNICISEYSSKLIDENFIENKKNINKSKLKKRNRIISVFGDGSYAITYRNEKTKAFYYTSTGNLEFIEFDTVGQYPRKGAKYDINGNLDGISLSVSPDNQYIFDKNKKLVAHWIGKNCYNENGELIDTRK